MYIYMIEMTIIHVYVEQQQQKNTDGQGINIQNVYSSLMVRSVSFVAIHSSSLIMGICYRDFEGSSESHNKIIGKLNVG